MQSVLVGACLERGRRPGPGPNVKLSRLADENTGLNLEVSELKVKLEEEKRKYKRLWRESCEQLAEYDSIVAEKDREIAALRARMAELEAYHPIAHHTEPVGHGSSCLEPEHIASGHTASVHSPTGVRSDAPVSQRRGKAPPIDSFDGESADVRFDDWLLTLQRAATWYGWSKEETLLQLAGHLRKRALQEWSLLDKSVRSSLDTAIASLHDRLDPGS